MFNKNSLNMLFLESVLTICAFIAATTRINLSHHHLPEPVLEATTRTVGRSNKRLIVMYAASEMLSISLPVTVASDTIRPLPGILTDTRPVPLLVNRGKTGSMEGANQGCRWLRIILVIALQIIQCFKTMHG